MTMRPVTDARPRRWLRILFLGAAAVLVLAGCGDDDGDDEAAESGNDTAESTTTAAAEDDPTTTESTDEDPTTTTSDEGTSTPTRPPKTEPVGEVDESDVEPWARTAVPYRGQIGEIVDFECPAGGEPGSLWGTAVYTDDSSVCTAAVHVGLITLEDGGTVSIEILDAQEEFVGSERNGLESRDYGSWGGAYSFPDAEGIEVPTGIPWDRNSGFYGSEVGERFTVTCRPDGEVGSVWGTDVYTSDSSICTAAVHAGLITLADGGEVTFEIAEGEESYVGSEANGVTSSDYGSWGQSFTFVEVA